MVIERSTLYRNLPETPGVYLMRGARREILYIGKAANLKRRVSSYFTHPHDARIETLISRIKRIDHRETATALEALILESLLIKQHQPPFNIREKDDTSFLYVALTLDTFPRVLLVRGKNAARRITGKLFGPFTSATSVREALKILRRIFPWSTHDPADLGTFKRACFDYEIGLCPGTCIGTASRAAYRKTIRNLALVLGGKTQAVLKSLEREMKVAARRLEFEEAARIRRQVFALRHVRDVALIREDEFLISHYSLPVTRIEGHALSRIEGYDISNISGTSAVGSMVVFTNGEPDKQEYRKFRIRTVEQSDDTAMLREILLRRFRRHDPAHNASPASNAERPPAAMQKFRAGSSAGSRSDAGGWPLPNVILIDGGVGQVHTAERVVAEAGLTIPVVGIAKGPERKQNDVIGTVPKGIDERTLIHVRDEAHRFAIAYHRKLRGRNVLQ